jgi:transcriptional regulator with XRE-family HTH domain
MQQDALAVALDVSRTSISNIERGHHRVFLDQVYAAARELGVDISDLLPTMEEVFPSSELRTSPDAMVSAQSVLTVTDLARTIQERAARDDLAHAPRNSTRSTTRS